MALQKILLSCLVPSNFQENGLCCHGLTRAVSSVWLSTLYVLLEMCNRRNMLPMALQQLNANSKMHLMCSFSQVRTYECSSKNIYLLQPLLHCRSNFSIQSEKLHLQLFVDTQFTFTFADQIIVHVPT